jgi:hypothetical protein
LRQRIARLSRQRRPLDAPPEVHVFYSGPTATDKAGYHKRQQLFGWNAALYVRELIPQMHRVGVAWGKTIARLIANSRLTAENGGRVDCDYLIERLEFYETEAARDLSQIHKLVERILKFIRDAEPRIARRARGMGRRQEDAVARFVEALRDARWRSALNSCRPNQAAARCLVSARCPWINTSARASCRWSETNRGCGTVSPSKNTKYSL